MLVKIILSSNLACYVPQICLAEFGPARMSGPPCFAKELGSGYRNVYFRDMV